MMKKHPEAAPHLKAALDALAADAFDATLKTHKLKGKLASSWSCSAGYDLRVLFQLVKHKGQDAILLEGLGTHDEVY